MCSYSDIGSIIRISSTLDFAVLGSNSSCFYYVNGQSISDLFISIDVNKLNYLLHKICLHDLMVKSSNSIPMIQRVSKAISLLF